MKDIPDIRVIYTGGTIGSEAKDGRVAPAGKASELARRWLAEGGRARITEDRPVEILSENISQDALDRMAAAVRRAVSEGADGIVLTHGTDTLDFTANYFGRVFGDLPVPLVLISALYPLSDPRSFPTPTPARCAAYTWRSACSPQTPTACSGDTAALSGASRMADTSTTKRRSPSRS